MSATMLAAGLGWLTLEPPALAMMSTTIVPSDPKTSPSATAAGAVHTGHGGCSSGPNAPTPGGAGSCESVAGGSS